MNYNPKLTGELSEAVILTHLLSFGYKVLKPWGDSMRYDLAVESCIDSKKILKIQCKTARFKKKSDSTLDLNVFEFSTCSTNWNRTYKNYKGEADLFGVFLPPIKEVYFFNINECGNKTCTVRLSHTKNNQLIGIRYACDHILTEYKNLDSFLLI